jgi:predicted DCC family thiol-disulfide oxidoreductase YuxK
MFTKLEKTKYAPKGQAVMAWDGNCGFCRYWVIKWKIMTGEKIRYQPFQEVYKEFPDIDLKYFQQAIRFIDLDGKIYTGPAAVFQALHAYANKWRWVMPLYNNFIPFRFLSDHFYSLVSRNRVKMYEVVIRLFGRNPARPKHLWAFYIIPLVLLILAIIIGF